MKEFWNKRYADEAYAYGEAPNVFFKEYLQQLKPGKLLLPAEGEGRNAVYAATLGWDVTAFDISTEAKIKAEKLANKYGVKINYHTNGFEEIEIEKESFDCVGLIFAHTPPDKRNYLHKLVQKWLKPGGVIILQGFSKQQINYSSGGPQNIEMLFSKTILEDDFDQLVEIQTEETTQLLQEGIYHKGEASLLSLIGKKNINIRL